MTTCVLKDLIEISKDGEWGKAEPSGDSVEMLCIRGTDFDDVRFGNTNSTPRRHIAKRIADRKMLQPWDLLIEAAGGTKNQITGRTVLLRPQLFSDSELPVTCASFSRFIRFKTDLCTPEFMFWYLQHLYGAGFMHAYHTQHTGVARFQWTTFSEREPLELPPLSVQQRIADVLSAYDEAIENNRRRIRTLEKMARALYREWFVHFRFPGHQEGKCVTSALGDIPLGWGVATLGNLTTKIGSGATPRGGKEAYHSEGMALIRSLNIYDYQFEISNLAYINDAQATQLDNVVVESGDVLLNITGASVARCSMVPSYILPARVNQHVAIIRANPQCMNPFYLLDTLNNDQNKQRLLGLAQGGATREALTKETISNFLILLPPLNLTSRYAEATGPVHIQREILDRQIQNLSRTRDLLLPRLLSGQMNLETI
jgi:type I restriction enzyme S subunit